MDIAKAVKTGKVKPAYITDKEKDLLLKRDKKKGSISEKFYKGVPVLYDDSVDPARSDYEGPSLPGEGPADGGPDDEHTTTAEKCRADGGRWEGGECKYDTDESACAAKGSGYKWNAETSTCEKVDSDSGSGGSGAGVPYEKAPPYDYKVPEVKPGRSISETKRADVRKERGTPFAEAVRESMMGELKSPTGETMGDRKFTLEDIDRKRAFNDAMLASAQKYASTGMSFSTPMLHAEEDMVRNLARKRLEGADEAARMDIELEMARWEAAEPIMKLAAMSKLGMPSMPAGIAKPGEFKPGHYEPSDVMEVPGYGLTIPGFSGLPVTTTKKPKTDDDTDDDDDDDTPDPNSHYTDKNGDTCYFKERYQESEGGDWICPGTTVGGGTT